jgi:hypothetical protein
MFSFVLIICCFSFALACALCKRMYEDSKRTGQYEYIMDVLISGISGLCSGFILSEYLTSTLAIIGISGACGLFGVEMLKLIVTYKLSSKIFIDTDCIKKLNELDLSKRKKIKVISKNSE